MSSYLTFDDIAQDNSILTLDNLTRDDDGTYILPDIVSDDGSIVSWRIEQTDFKAPEGEKRWILTCSCRPQNADSDAGSDNKVTILHCGNDDTGDIVSSTTAVPWNTPQEALNTVLMITNAGDDDDPRDSSSDDNGESSDTDTSDDAGTDDDYELDEYVPWSIKKDVDEAVDRYDIMRSAIDNALGFDSSVLCTMPYKEYRERFSHYHVVGERRFSKAENAFLIARYPFLGCFYWDAHDDDSNLADDAHARMKELSINWFNDMPDGWFERFGVDLAEDIRNSVYHEDPTIWERRLCGIIIEQVKEKFGGLRVYARTPEHTDDIISVYSELSEYICVECGETLGTRITRGGWISPFCPRCYIGRMHELYRHAELVDASVAMASSAGIDTSNWSWKDKSDAKTVYDFDRFISETSPCPTGSELRRMHETFSFQVWDENGRHERNIAPGLLDGTPFANGEPVRVASLIDELAEDADRIRSYEQDGWVSDKLPVQLLVGEAAERIGYQDLPKWNANELAYPQM